MMVEKRRKLGSRRAGACIVLRPDPVTGELVQVGQRPKPATVREGRFVVWDDLCQTERAGDALAVCARYIAENSPLPDHEQVVRMGKEGPQLLNPAELAELQRMVREGPA